MAWKLRASDKHTGKLFLQLRKQQSFCYLLWKLLGLPCIAINDTSRIMTLQENLFLWIRCLRPTDCLVKTTWEHSVAPLWVPKMKEHCTVCKTLLSRKSSASATGVSWPTQCIFRQKIFCSLWFCRKIFWVVVLFPHKCFASAPHNCVLKSF